MMNKFFSRIASARLLILAVASLATLALQAFDTPYLTFRSSMPFSLDASSQSWDGTIEYSTDASTWTTWTGSSISAALSGGQYRIFLRGTGNTVVSNGSYWSLPAMGDVYCEGDIETLRDYNGNPPAMGASCYKSMFSGCNTLKSAPTLSATTLAVRCYDSMFAGCTILAEAPTLPARTMVGYCYYNMFSDCTALKNPPELPAMDLADNCYAGMFARCTGLISLPDLPATTTMFGSYYSMFDGCSSLVINQSGDGVEWSLPTMVSAGSIYNSNMFRGTGGDFTGNPVAGTTYYVESALPPGLHIIKGKNELAAYTGASVDIDLAETIKGGATPYEFTGAVPAGLTLNPNGKLTGSLSVADTYNFTLTVTDSTSPDALTLNAAEYTLVVSDPDPLSSTTTDLGTAKVGKTKDIDLSDTISGGVPPYTFEFNGAHDAAFALDGAILKFTPSAAQNYNCAITVKDALLMALPVTYTVAAVESAGFTDDDPDEPETGTVVYCLTPDGLLPRTCSQVVDSSTSVTWDNGWYYVTGNVTLSKGAVVNGKVSLILCDDATLTVTGVGYPDYSAGILVTEGNALTIYAQSTGDNKGRLTASASSYSAAIGGSRYSQHAGKVNIYGGNISATGNLYGSGIGGGQDGNGGIVTINGGTITVNGGSSGSGIGGGRNGNGGVVTINGGAVTAIGGSSGSGIGGGNGGNGGVVTINGGEVVATGYYSSGIGGGNGGTGGALTVNGGTVSASGHNSTASYYPGVGAYGSVDQGTLAVAANVVVKAGANASLTDADIQNPNGETAISLATKYQYYSFAKAPPAPLTQKISALYAYIGESFRIVLSDTVSGGTVPYTFALKGGEEFPAGFIIDKGALYCASVTSGGTFTLVVTDNGSQVKEFTYTVNVAVRPRSITYIDGEDGTTELVGLEPTTYTPGTATPLPATATKMDRAFEGWYRDDKFTVGPVDTIPDTERGDVTFFAKWRNTEAELPYLRFSSTSTFSIKLPNTKYWDGVLEYKNTAPSVNDGWTVGTPAATMSAAKAGDGKFYLYVRGTGNTCITRGFKWALTAYAPVTCTGDIEKLREYNGTPLPMAPKCYYSMFAYWPELVKAPILSATALADECYDGMFHACYALTQAPELPATTLARACYESMFADCTNLTVAPVLPALVATTNCYFQMFYGCTSLAEAPALPATTLAKSCYFRMFSGTAVTAAPALPATTLAENCYGEMFRDCNLLAEAPALPGTGTAPAGCYASMFEDCKGLKTAPTELTAETLEGNCYYRMFRGCSALTNAPAIAATTAASRSCESMFEGCTSIETAPELFTETISDHCFCQMFYGCTSLTTAPTNIPAATMKSYCFQSMFEGCTSLTNAPTLSAETTAEGCFDRMFYGCSSLGSAQESLPATTSMYCFRNMFHGCSNLTNAPSLPAKTVNQSGYEGMFELCSKLEVSPELEAKTLSRNCYKRMFKDCARLTKSTFWLPAKTLYGSCYEQMFSGCSKLEEPPFISAESSADSCCKYMFQNCISLKTPPSLWSDTIPLSSVLSVSCYAYMFQGCTSLTNAPALHSWNLAPYCFQNMFEGCTSITTLPVLNVNELKTGCYSNMFLNCSSLSLTDVETPNARTWNIPAEATVAAGSLTDMFTGTKGPFAGTPVKGTTYYVLSAPPKGISLDETAEFHAYAGREFSVALGDAISGGVPPYHFTGYAPIVGTTLEEDGRLHGTVLKAGFYNFELTSVADSAEPTPNSIERARFTLVVSEVVPMAAETVESFVIVGQTVAFDVSESVSGGVKPYSYAVSGSLPDGFTFNDATGVLSVRATETYDGRFARIVVTDQLGDYVNADFSIDAVASTPVGDDEPDEPATGVSVQYRGADGGMKNRVCKLLEPTDTVWQDNWYYAIGDISFPNGVTVKGNVCLILADDANVTLQGAAHCAGINITVEDESSFTNSLAIFAESEGTGALSATGGTDAPGIGGSYGFNTGKLTVNGGIITAQGCEEAAGIGSAPNRAAGMVVINGGTVTATAGQETDHSYGAGIGGGRSMSGGVVYINGGTVRAVGGLYGAGIGGGDHASGGTTYFYGGTVMAIGGNSDCAGIGRGNRLPSSIPSYGKLYVYADYASVTCGTREDLLVNNLLVDIDTREVSYRFGPQSPNYQYLHIEVDPYVRLKVSDTDLGSVNKGDVYFSRNFDLRMIGGIGPYTYALRDEPGNVLPGGLRINDEGSLVGTPTEAGVFAFTIDVEDSTVPRLYGSFTFTLKVNEKYSISYWEYDANSETKSRVYPLPATYDYFEGTGIAADDMPVPTKKGFDFAGWYDNAALQGEAITSISAEETGNKKLYASWTPTIYTITYRDASDSEDQEAEGDEILGLEPSYYTINYGVTLPSESDVLAVLSKPGYDFAGWYDNPQHTGSPVTGITAGSTGDKTFHAKWEEQNVPFAPVANADELYGEACEADAWDLAEKTVSGGKKPYTFALKDMEDNELPGGLELSEAGVLSGTVPLAGIYTFTVTATDSLGATLDIEYTLEVGLSKMTGNDGPDAELLIGYWTEINLAQAIRGGRPPFNFSPISEYGALPSGMVLNGTKLEGTASKTGSYHFALTVTDSDGHEGFLLYYINVSSDSRVNTKTVNGIDWKYVWATPDKDPTGRITFSNGGSSAIPTATTGHVFVPSTEVIGIRALTAWCIGAGAFANCADVTQVTLWPEIRVIGEGAFAGCTSLKTVTIPMIDEIQANAFQGCTAIEKVYVGTAGGAVPGEKAAEIEAKMAASGYDVSGVDFVEGALRMLTLDANLGTELDMSEFYVVEGAPLGNLPAPERYNYTFDGWYTEKFGGTLVTAETTLDADTTFYAHWTTTLPPPVFTTEVNWQGKVVLKSVDLKGNTEIVIPDNVQIIDALALFRNEHKSILRRVTIPSSVEEIGLDAFAECANLREVYIESGETSLSIGISAFKRCESLQAIDIPGRVTSIGDYAFAWCSGLVNMTIDSGLVSIGDSAFYNCTSLEGDGENGLVVPDTVKTIGTAAFNNSGVRRVKLPKGVDVGDWAFYGCKRLRSINVAGASSILLFGKRGKTLLGGASSNPDATSLGKYAFSGCGNLESATLGKDVENVGGGVFAGCTKLKSITVESGGNYASRFGMLLSLDLTTLVSAYGEEKDVAVPSGVTTIDSGAFADYTTVTNVTIPKSVTTIGEAAFSNATELVSAWIPKNVTVIGSNAFYGTRLATAHVMEGDTSRMGGLVSGSGYAVAGVRFVEDYPEETKPSIPGDPGATVTGDEIGGYTIKPSTTEGTVEVTIPDGVASEKVTVVVPPNASVKPNGANVAVVKTVNETPYDITEFLDLPAPNASGVVDLSAATVREEIVKEALDPTKEGVDIDMNPSDPGITTAATRPGLTYTFSEGTSLEGMTQKATKTGDGKSWTPPITVKGGTCGFYSIGVQK